MTAVTPQLLHNHRRVPFAAFLICFTFIYLLTWNIKATTSPSLASPSQAFDDNGYLNSIPADGNKEILLSEVSLSEAPLSEAPLSEAPPSVASPPVAPPSEAFNDNGYLKSIPADGNEDASLAEVSPSEASPSVAPPSEASPSEASDHNGNLDSTQADDNEDPSPSEVFGLNGNLTSTPASGNEDVAFCIAIKNQYLDLPEFLIHHYHHHDIRRFYIMDDQSDPPLSNFADYGIPKSAISFQYYDARSQEPEQLEMQGHIYSECARLYGPLHKWMAFIDVDEFLETRAPHTLRSILEDLDTQPGVGALGINWRLHTSAGLLKKPYSVRQSFNSCVVDAPGPPPQGGWKDNRAIKSIVKTDLFDEPWSPHMFKTKNWTKTVGEHGDILVDRSHIRVPITRDKIALHHYTTKSKEQFERKMTLWTAKDWTYWDHIEGLPQVECLEMMAYDP